MTTKHTSIGSEINSVEILTCIPGSHDLMNPLLLFVVLDTCRRKSLHFDIEFYKHSEWFTSNKND